jgi:hypothetical protein
MYADPTDAKGIFVSYRRADASGHAGRLYDRLTLHFQDERVFMDVDSLAPGVDYAEVIESAIRACDIFVLVIGPRWDLEDAAGRRLEQANDFMRFEISTAIDREMPIIPVLVDGAAMPSVTRLPRPLRKLARLQALPLSNHRWQADAERLINAIEGRRHTGALPTVSPVTSPGPPSAQPAASEADEVVPPSSTRSRRTGAPTPLLRMMAIAAIACVVAIAIVGYAVTRPGSKVAPVVSAASGGPAKATLAGAAAALAASISDPAIANTCVKSPHPGGRATLNCESTTPGGQTVVLHVDLFGSDKFVKKNYSDDALSPYKAAGGTRGAGACAEVTWRGEGPWARGRRACFIGTRADEGCKGLGAAECSIVYWFDEPSRVAVRATVAGARFSPELSDWWDAHKWDFGG